MARAETTRCLLLGFAVLIGLGAAATASAEGTAIADVWARKDDYWRFIKAGDVDSYTTLWHENFIGWPCHEDHPVRKSSIGGWVKDIRDKKIAFTSALTREGAQDFGQIVVVHYRTTMVSAYPDGHVEGRGEESKITHTWMKVGNTWQIVGGMCGRMKQ